jgi:hypothetical protein
MTSTSGQERSSGRPRPVTAIPKPTRGSGLTDNGSLEEAQPDIDHIPDAVHRVADITVSEDLIRYAVQAQLYHTERTPDDILGPHSPFRRADLARYLSGEEPFPAAVLRTLDEMIVTVSDKSHVGGLAPFASRVRERAENVGVSVKIPPGWVRDNMHTQSNDELHVLVQASTLLSSFIAANYAGLPSDVVRTRHARTIERVTDRLILLAGGPPTPRHYEAHALLGSLAKYSLDTVLARLETSIKYRPLGFRSWRPLTKLMVIAREDESDERLRAELRKRIPQLVNAHKMLRENSINPGRSLDLEFFIAIPWGWAGAGAGGEDDRVNEVLFERARDDTTTLRERGTAAMGYWYRAYESGRSADRHVRQQVISLVKLFDDPDRRADIGLGLSWVARTLEIVLEKNVQVGNDWPAVDEPWYRAVRNAAQALEQGLPASISGATANLFFHSVLQNAGVERRKALDTLRTGGLVDEVAQALTMLLHDDPQMRDESWLRIRALFALGFMRARDHRTEADLVAAFEKACDAVHRARPTGAQIGELQTAVFTLGDIFGVTGVEDQNTLERAGVMRTQIGASLRELVEGNLIRDPRFHTVARAAAYLLTFTAMPGATDLSRDLLAKMSDHPDAMTKRFSQWALGFRWAADHSVRPLLYGVE